MGLDIAFRSIKSLAFVSCSNFSASLLYKFVTCVNLFLKSLAAAVGLNAKLMEWPFNDQVMTARFENITYCFYLARKNDSNIYLNPYFHEYDVASFVANNLKEGDVFFDVGAHCGLYTIIASKRVGAKGMVVSIEPNPENISYLIKNIKMNDLGNVIIIPKALGQKEGKIKLFYRSGATALTSYEMQNRFICFEAEQVTLDAIIKELKINHIKMVKIDTEGYDEQVLRGGQRALQKTKYVIVELNTSDLRRILLNMGFNLYTSQPSRYILAIKSR